MKSKTIVLKIINLIVALLIAVFSISYAFSWFVDSTEQSFNFGGSSGSAYFAGGTGKSDDPYLITDAYHMYNLAWLQNTGKLTSKFYFALGDDVDMSSLWLPPIGNDDNPFIGDFDGKGYTIKNLKITTNKTRLTGTPMPSDYAFSNAVGLFGMTDSTSYIHNVILDNPYIEVVSENDNDSNVETSYNTSGEKTAEKVVGIAIGYVAGKASSIGVLATDGDASTYAATAIDLQRTGYKTFNSILGDLAGGVSSSVTGGGNTGSGGSGSSFGASFDVQSLATRLKKILANNGASPMFPNLDTQNDYPLPALGYKVPFTVDSTKSSYEGATAKEVTASDNIGYVMGNQNKISEKTLNFTDNLMQLDATAGQYYLADSDGNFILDSSGNKTTPTNNAIPRWFYVQDGGWNNSEYKTQFGFAPISQAKYDSLPEGIQNILHPTSNSPTMVMRIQAEYTQYTECYVTTSKYDSASWGYHGQITWNGNTYGEGFNRDGYIANENGVWIDSTSGKLIDDDNGYVYWLNNNIKSYLLGVDGYPNATTIEDDGRIKYKWGDWYFKDSDGNDFNVYDGVFSINDNNVLVDESNNQVYLIDAWNNTKAAVPLEGTKIASYTYDKGIALPNNGLWFKPAVAGTIRFVMFAQKDSEAFCLLRITREGATSDNPFYTANSGDIKVEKILQQQLPVYVLFYYEFEVTADEIEAGNVEYTIMVDNNVTETTDDGTTTTTNYKGAYFVYMDIGSSAPDSEDTSTVTSDAVSAVDFIYTGVQISQDEETTGIAAGNFIIQNKDESYSQYNASKTSVYFDSLSYVLKIVYIRLNGDTSNGHTSTQTICLAESVVDNAEVGHSAETLKDKGVVASDTDKVCPTVGQGSSSSSSGGTNTDTGGDTGETTVAVTGVTLDQSSLSLTVGKGEQLTATISPTDATNSAVTWSSDNESVATVDSTGNVTAVAAGTATITVTTDDGGYTETCTVTVTAATTGDETGGETGGETTIYSSALMSLTSAGTATSDGVITARGDTFEVKTDGTYTYNGVTYTDALRAAGNGRYFDIKVSAGQTVTVLFGGNVGSNNSSATMNFADSSGNTIGTAVTTTNVGKVASGILTHTFETAGTYRLVCDNNKPCVFAIIISN